MRAAFWVVAHGVRDSAGRDRLVSSSGSAGPQIFQPLDLSPMFNAFVLKRRQNVKFVFDLLEAVATKWPRHGRGHDLL